MSTQKKWLYTFLTVTTVGAIAFLITSVFTAPTIKVIDKKILFEKFTMTLEAKKRGEAAFNRLNYELDSLRLLTAADENRQRMLTQEIEQRSQALADLNGRFWQEESSSIWERIDTYVAEYAKEKKIKILLAKDVVGGNVLYFDKEYDITADVLQYVNKRYEGQN
ncbi:MULTISPECIES: OmpH family outer membrane protein [unclassified Flavobacterium]|uniref:OmpH family outer membrane protein n=1 Tax=unclassified Flavobacterium TaxID=196869 RepID=UPI001F13050A|nr:MULTISPECIES: OmpH family outer membrane protein [unclassified Flavobacterium]UMY66242.1 OmpH family outer membrane protein [Flavobacterium sp. HJ-32-4]